jgi:hypothetical protein
MNHRAFTGKVELVSEKTDAARIHAGWNIAPIRMTDMASVTLYVADARPPPKFLQFSVIGTTVRF